MIRCSSEVVAQTLQILREPGEQGKECVVLWLADRRDRGLIIEAYRPDHEAAFDRFWIKAEAMEALMRHLREHKLSLVAQVHSHPEKAFHSKTDDRYAIVRYEGALSIVVPFFAKSTPVTSFVPDCAFFVLTADNTWVELPQDRVPSHFEMPL